MHTVNRENKIRAVKWILNILIFVFLAQILAVAWTGGFEFQAAGIRVSSRNISNPLLIAFCLCLIRFFLGIGWINSLTVIGTLLFAALITEAGLRVVDLPVSLPSLKHITERSNVLGYKLVPNLRDGSIRINSHGLRDRERTWEKPEGVRRVLGIGDSFTFGYQVDVKDCYLKQLERSLNKGSGRWDVINAGVTGYNMWQYLAYLKCCGYRYSPDLIIIGVFFDDFNGDPVTDSKSPEPQRYRSLSALRIVNLIRNSFEILKYRYRHLLGATWLKSIEERRTFINSTADGLLLKGKAEPQKYRKFEIRLRELLQFAEAHQSRVLVFLIPDAIQLRHPELQAMNRILREICQRCGAAFLDLTPAFEQVQDINSLYLLPYDAHTSPLGHGIIANQLEKRILKMYSQ